MCISSNWVNDAQDSIAVKKFRDFPNSLIPTVLRDHVTIDTGPAAEPGLHQQQQPVAASRIKQNSGPGVANSWGLSLYYAISVLPTLMTL